eukprot:5877321-Pleurochrysis_carterae.AAC.1
MPSRALAPQRPLSARSLHLTHLESGKAHMPSTHLALPFPLSPRAAPSLHESPYPSAGAIVVLSPVAHAHQPTLSPFLLASRLLAFDLPIYQPIPFLNGEKCAW